MLGKAMIPGAFVTRDDLLVLRLELNLLVIRESLVLIALDVVMQTRRRGYSRTQMKAILALNNCFR